MHVAMATNCYISTYTSFNHGWQRGLCERDMSHATATITAQKVWNDDDDDERAAQLIHQLGFGVFSIPVPPTPSTAKMHEPAEEKNEVWLSDRKCYTHA